MKRQNKIITEKQIRILRLLGYFKYLTYRQLVVLKEYTQTSNAGADVRELVRRKLVGSYTLGNEVGGEKLNFLLPAGAEILMEEEGIQSPRFLKKANQHVRGTSLMHDAMVTDFHIAMVQRFAQQMDFFEAAHFYRKGESQTKVKFGDETLIPDAVFRLRSPSRYYLYALELQRGWDTGRMERKIAQHFEAMKQNAIGQKYGYDKHPRVLLVFEHEALRDGTMKRMAGKYENAKTHFAFATLEEVKQDLESFTDFNGQRMGVFF